MAIESRAVSCGDCRFFKTAYTDGTPYPWNDNAKVKLGVCRTNYGLILRDILETTKCRQPNEFAPKEEVIVVLGPPQVATLPRLPVK